MTKIVAALLFIITAQSAGAITFVTDGGNAEYGEPIEGLNILRWTKKEKIKVDTTQNLEILDEKVIVGKDTISVILPERNYGRYDRGLYNFLFIPKGQWEIGLTASYGEFNISDYQILDLATDVDFKLKGYSINPEVSYFFKHNQSVGLRFDLSNYEGGINSFLADIDDDMNFNLSGVSYRSTTYSMAAFYRHYLGLSKNGRFGVFNEVDFKLGGGDSYFTRNYNGIPKDTKTNIFQFGLDFSPGLCVYIHK